MPGKGGGEISPKIKNILFTTSVVITTVAACAAVIYYWEYIERFQNYGYLSAFVFGFFAGSSLPLPLPYLVVTFTFGGVLNPALIGLASGFGAGIGGTLVYLFGHGGSKLIPKLGFLMPKPEDEAASSRTHQFISKLQDWTHQRGSLVVFVMSAMLNPAFGPMALTIGALHFGLWRFFFWCTAGNIIKSLIIAYCGYFGLGSLLRWLGQF